MIKASGQKALVDYGEAALFPIACGFLRCRDMQFAAVLCLTGMFSVVAWCSVQWVNTLWDEQQDYPIAVALGQNPLWGSGDHGSQARLPMYAVAGAIALFGESLAVARLVSIVMGASTIVITWVAGRRWFGGTTGLLAAALLAVSPYFIGFSRTALTEGDAFCPLTVLLALVAVDTYFRRRDSWGVLLLSASLGLAIAAKFFAAVLIPTFLACDLLHRRETHISNAEPTGQTYRTAFAWIATAACIELLAIVAAQTRYVFLSVILWAVGASVMLLASYWLMSRRGVRWPGRVAWPASLLLALTICLAAFPEHAIHPAVVGDFLARFHDWDDSQPSATLIANARLYSGVILLKLGVPLGLLTVAALLWGSIRAFLCDGPLRRIVLVVVAYLIVLLLLPLRQTFYLMSIYPLVVLLLAHFLVRNTSTLHRRPFLKGVWLSMVVASHLWLLWGAMRVYPEFGWYGYETIGDRWLGEESRGYRNVIQVTNDGTEDALRWLAAHVPAEAGVVSYFGDHHVVDAFIRRHPISFLLIQGGGHDGGPHTQRIADHGYLVVSLHTVLDGEIPLVRPEAMGMALVHTIWRGRGCCRMPMVRIYRARMTDP